MDNYNNHDPQNNKVQFDPGWNDPPTFTYNAQQTPPNRPRLNKRVAFPLSNNGTTVSLPPVNMPLVPTMLAGVPVVPPSLHKNISASNEQDTTIDSDRLLNEVKEVLLGILDNSKELGTKIESIRKKISTMEEMWTSGKINTQVQLKMQELSQALKEDRPSRAEEIHKELMVDHVSSVGIWMPGVKQLIYHSIARTELLAIDELN